MTDLSNLKARLHRLPLGTIIADMAAQARAVLSLARARDRPIRRRHHANVSAHRRERRTLRHQGGRFAEKAEAMTYDRAAIMRDAHAGQKCLDRRNGVEAFFVMLGGLCRGRVSHHHYNRDHDDRDRASHNGSYRANRSGHHGGPNVHWDDSPNGHDGGLSNGHSPNHHDHPNRHRHSRPRP